MAKKNKRKNARQNHTTSQKSPAQEPAEALVEEAAAVGIEALEDAEAAGGDGAATPPAEEVPRTPGVDDLKTACLDARKAQAIYRQLHSSLETEQRKLSRDQERVSKKESDLDDRKKEIQSRLRELDAKEKELGELEKKLARKDAELADLERTLKERELKAEAGFAEKNREALVALAEDKAALDESIREARAELLTVREEVRDARARWSSDQHEQVQAALERLEARSAEIETEREALDEERAKVEKRRRDAALREADLDVDRAAFDERVAHAVDTAHAQLRLEYERLNARVNALVAQLTEREAEIAELQTARRRAQGRSPEELVQERDALREKVEALEVDLAERPGTDDLQRLRDLERTRETERRELEVLRQEKAALQLKADRADHNVVELSELRSLKESYEAKIALLAEELRQLGGQVEKHHGKHGPFPLCTRLDGEMESTREPKLSNVPKGGLTALADHARYAMAQRDPALYYNEKTVRLFLAGLATSHLILLEGISGTGKSSLPEAFARAIGGISQSVAVQASWRDRHDLLGHYNSFERQFAETDLLRHLYQAQLPAYADRPYLVVLDEMNLARPEYYFADFLSKLEDRARLGAEGEVYLGLVDNELVGQPLPRHLRRATDGISIRLPDNVWFVGTANQDESTLKFAPKTYDRAHVMELPRSPDRFEPARPTELTVSWTALERAFDEAAGTATQPGTHAQVAEEVWERITVNWEERLFQDFKLSWGNRLERQVRRFAPVLAAAGGSATEAVDHLLASKILSKLKGRFDLDPDDLTALAEELEVGDLPDATAVVRTELKRIEA